MPKPSPVIGVREAARILDKDKMTVLRWIEIGKLPSIGRLPGRNGAILLDRAEVMALAHKLAS